MNLSRMMALLALATTLAACGPLAGGPTPVVQGGTGPAAAGSLGGTDMGPNGANGGMGNGGGVTAGGGVAVH